MFGHVKNRSYFRGIKQSKNTVMKARYLYFCKYSDGSTATWIAFIVADISVHNVNITRKEYRALRAVLKAKGYQPTLETDEGGYNYVYYDFDNKVPELTPANELV